MTRQPPPGMNETVSAEVEGRTPAPVPHLRGIASAQITMGRGLVDVSRIEHEGRAGILFRPREKHIPIGDGGDLQAGEYWPVEGDVVIWIENESGAQVVQNYLTPFLPAPWVKVPEELPQELLRLVNVNNQVLAYENGRYYNAWFEFEPSEGGWFWTDDADSEPSPSHYMALPADPDLAAEGPQQ